MHIIIGTVILKLYCARGHEAICWSWVSTYVGAVYRYHTQHTVVVKDKQNFKKNIYILLKNYNYQITEFYMRI